MKRWIGIFGIIFGGLWIACSRDVAGSTFETENSVAIVVIRHDGKPAAKSRLNIRQQGFLNLEGIPGETLETDSLGTLRLDSLPVGDYTVEAQSLSEDTLQKGIRKFSVPGNLADSGMEVLVSTDAPSKLSGTILTEKSPVWILLPGTDYAALADSGGHFEFPSLPRGDLEWVALYTADSQNVPLAEGIFDISTREREVILQDTATRAFVLDDFENGIANWYRSASKYATANLELDSTESPNGKSAHFVSQNDSSANWALMGRYLGRAIDMSGLDSVSFLAKGSVKGKISFSFDVIADSSASYESGKAWEHIQLDSAWMRYTVKPGTLLAADSVGGNVGWENVKSHVTNISVFGGAGGEFWIDDIVFYGVDFQGHL